MRLFVSILLIAFASVTHARAEAEMTDFAPETLDSLGETGLLPLGHMVVDKKTNEGLLLVCTHPSQDHCSEMRFVHFANADEPSQWSWASPAVGAGLHFSSLHFDQKQKAMQTWVKHASRKEIKIDRNPNEFTTGFVGFYAGSAGFLGYLFCGPGSPDQKLVFGLAGFATIVVLGKTGALNKISVAAAKSARLSPRS